MFDSLLPLRSSQGSGGDPYQNFNVAPIAAPVLKCHPPISVHESELLSFGGAGRDKSEPEVYPMTDDKSDDTMIQGSLLFRYVDHTGFAPSPASQSFLLGQSSNRSPLFDKFDGMVKNRKIVFEGVLLADATSNEQCSYTPTGQVTILPRNFMGSRAGVSTGEKLFWSKPAKASFNVRGHVYPEIRVLDKTITRQGKDNLKHAFARFEELWKQHKDRDFSNIKDVLDVTKQLVHPDAKGRSELMKLARKVNGADGQGKKIAKKILRALSVDLFQLMEPATFAKGGYLFEVACQYVAFLRIANALINSAFPGDDRRQAALRNEIDKIVCDAQGNYTALVDSFWANHYVGTVIRDAAAGKPIYIDLRKPA